MFLLYLIVFLINIKIKKYVAQLFRYIIFQQYIILINKTQKKCDEAVDNYLAALKFFPNYFVTSKILKKFDNTLHANNDILFHNEDFDKVTFIANQINILAVDLEKINLDNNFDEDDVVNLKNAKHLKKR